MSKSAGPVLIVFGTKRENSTPPNDPKKKRGFRPGRELPESRQARCEKTKRKRKKEGVETMWATKSSAANRSFVHQGDRWIDQDKSRKVSSIRDIRRHRRDRQQRGSVGVVIPRHASNIGNAPPSQTTPAPRSSLPAPRC